MMKLSDLINKDNNNLDIFRLIAALMVIYGHAYAISPQEGKSDFILNWIGFDYSGSLAVKIFFFLSGLVVTNSLMANKSVVKFFISRIFRIWPALIVTLVVSSFLLGPLITKNNISDYFSSKEVYSYIYNNVLLRTQFSLPGLFSENHNHVVNGSLWTIPYEVGAYLILISLFMLGVMKSRAFASLLFVLIVVEPLLGNNLIFTWIPSANREISMLAPCFAFGAMLAIWKDKITINLYSFLGVWLLFYFFRSSPVSFYFLYVAVFISIVYLSSIPALVRAKLPFDISYGVYLWAWPVQQMVAQFFHGQGVLANQIVSSVIAIILGVLSWYLVEKKFIRVGARLGRRLSDKYHAPIQYSQTVKEK